VKTEYLHRVMIVVPIEDKKKANDLMVKITGRPEDVNTFTVELLDTITGLPTHLIAYMSASEAEKGELLKFKDTIPNASWWRMDKDENKKEASDNTVKVNEKIDHQKEIEKHGLKGKDDHQKEIEARVLKVKGIDNDSRAQRG